MSQNPFESFNEIIRCLQDQITTQNENTINLILRTTALEAVQLRLFSALAETNPSVHSTIVGELATVLDIMKENGHQDLVFADHLRALTGIKAESKPLLKLVPKRVSPDSGDKKS